MAKPGQPIRYSLEDKGRYVSVDVNRWISEHTISAQTSLLDDTGAGIVHAH
ncbi:MAG: hypothetical protein KJP23_22210 [Deltaproteobacteria bacterium]|nr:hypothetical protein [Deltaproteobacteria bacterium]